MRIGIDARPLAKQRTGIGRFLERLVTQLPRLAPQDSFVLYSNRDFKSSLPIGNFRVHVDHLFKLLPGAFWLRARGAGLARRDDLDVFWSPCPLLPANLTKRVLKVITVHDLVWLKFPKTTSNYNLLVEKLWTHTSIKEADRIVVVSKSTQEDLVKTLGVPIEKTVLVYNGVDERYKPSAQAEAARFIALKYGVPERYLATVGIVHPRKNHQFLVQVLGILKRRGQLDCPLLIVGPMGWKNSSLFREIRTAGLSENDIRFMGYMPDEDMPQFYAGAQAFVFPTLYEGFGLPPVEAMACGTPVISSDAPAMPEVLGDAAILESLSNVERFADAIRDVLTNEKLRETLSKKGIQQAATFQYELSAKQILEMFER
jgi:glycosyltransferase involved in cell wall biosynthesis